MSISSSNIFFKRAQQRTRLTPKALKARLASELRNRPAFSKQGEAQQLMFVLQEMATTQPAPLRGVADMAAQEQERLRKGIIDDAKQYTRQWLAANKAMAEMRAKWEMYMNSLEALRLDVHGYARSARA